MQSGRVYLLAASLAQLVYVVVMFWPFTSRSYNGYYATLLRRVHFVRVTCVIRHSLVCDVVLLPSTVRARDCAYCVRKLCSIVAVLVGWQCDISHPFRSFARMHEVHAGSLCIHTSLSPLLR